MYNKELNLTEEMILAEKDISVIRQWETELEMQMNDFNVRTSTYKKLTFRQAAAYQSMKGLWRLCRSRLSDHIAQLKEQGVWKSSHDRKNERHLASVFMKIAKETLDKDLYKSILTTAQSKINEG